MSLVTNNAGILFILSSPSGAGKTTISKKIIQLVSNIKLSISYTTRIIRSKEINKKDYFFISKDKFIQLVSANSLLEHAKVYDNFYGTSKSSVDEFLAAGNDVLFDIDWQGAEQLRKNKSYRIVSIFILPPSLDELEIRLKTRAEDSKKTQSLRLKGAKKEIKHFDEYDYLIINDNLEISIQMAISIICAERLRLFRISKYQKFVNKMF